MQYCIVIVVAVLWTHGGGLLSLPRIAGVIEQSRSSLRCCGRTVGGHGAGCTTRHVTTRHDTGGSAACVRRTIPYNTNTALYRCAMSSKSLLIVVSRAGVIVHCSLLGLVSPRQEGLRGVGGRRREAEVVSLA